MMPTETEITHFLEVYSTKHFTRASIKLGITQPTLTQSIFRLEEKLGTELFHRTKQGCIPTRTAGIFYDKATHLRELWADLSIKVTASNQNLSGIFRVGCHQSVGTYTLPKFLNALAKQAPEIEIRLHHDWSRKIAEKIIHYEIDLGFVVNPVRHPDLVLKKIGTDRVGFWKAKAVHYPKTRIFADANLAQVRELLGKKNAPKYKDWQVIETSSLELIRSLVLSGAGIGVLPERIAKLDGSELELVDSSLPVQQDEIYMIYRMDTLRSVAGKALIDAGKECI
jgi:DNA-binding transcriptional LysR family regulator